jgi:hypothetical protein
MPCVLERTHTKESSANSARVGLRIIVKGLWLCKDVLKKDIKPVK